MNFVIFDIDGTLTDTKSVDDACFIKAFEETFQLDIRNEKWEKLQNVTDWGITEEIIQREKNRTPSAEEYQLMKNQLVENLGRSRMQDPSQFQEIEGSKNFFHSLREHPAFQIGIATGAWEKSAKLKLDAIGIQVDQICFSNSDHHKSREAITLDVIQQLKKQAATTPDRIIYFGDGEWDYKTCQNLEIEFIGIDHKKDGKLLQAGAKNVFKNYLDHKVIMKLLH